METVWVTGKYYFGQRTPVCDKTSKRVKQDIRNQEQIVDSVSPTDRWTNRKNKLRIRAILENVH